MPVAGRLRRAGLSSSGRRFWASGVETSSFRSKAFLRALKPDFFAGGENIGRGWGFRVLVETETERRRILYED